MPLSISELKKKACDAITAASEELNDVSQEIWKNPELLFEEHHAHKVLTDFLEKHGFPLERNYVLNTAFRSILGEGDGPTAAVLCEYDALPEIGHACGHNLIAEVGVGAAIGIKAALEAAAAQGQELGKLHVLGTPAEEGGCGKGVLVKAGTFETVDFAMMCHPAPLTLVDCGQLILCMQIGYVKFHGKASHAAAFPWEGINALDAAVMAYNNISALRQQIKPTWRIHGVISNGGIKPNIIPEETEMSYCIRAPTKKETDILRGKVSPCFEAAAKATGCTVDIQWNDDTTYLNVISNEELGTVFQQNGVALGISFDSVEAGGALSGGATDMGNVSYEVASIHPFFSIESSAVNHSREFTAAAGAAKAQPYTLAQAKALAMTAIDMYCQPELVTKMKQQFKEDINKSN